MSTESLALKTETEEHVNQELLNFLDYTVLLLSQANTAEEIDLIMDDFMSEDLLTILSNNNSMFNILSIIWLNTFKRVFFTNNEKDFPLKLMRISSLFKELNWKSKCEELLAETHRECLMLTVEDNSVRNFLLLLFIEGIIFSYQNAVDKFENRISNRMEDREP